jgi:hypothetical protein
VPDEEYTFAMIEVHKNSKFRALWLNANTSPEMNGLRDNDMLLLWPLSLFEKKPAESLKDPLIAGTVKLTKQENGTYCVVAFYNERLSRTRARATSRFSHTYTLYDGQLEQLTNVLY